MDSLPPNDPNRNNNNNGNGRAVVKEAPYDGRSRRSQRNRGGRDADGAGAHREGEPMDVLGNMEDSPAVVAMFLVGVVSWFLRTRCVC